MELRNDQETLPAATEPSRTNWAGNYLYSARSFVQPASMPAMREAIAADTAIKAVGSRHSFNHIADTTGTQLALSQFKSMVLDEAARTVTVGGGTTYGELAPWLHARGYALGNLASLPHISVAGACATGTHGSGTGNQCLSAAVRGMEIVTANGTVISISADEDPGVLKLATVHLGALGVVTSLTLRVVPTFQIAQTVYENLSFSELEHHLPEIMGAGYSVSLFTDWQEHRVTQAWVKRRVETGAAVAPEPTFFGAQRQRTKLHPLPGLDAGSCTEQQGIPGPWYERLPHFRLDYTPSAGAELQTEYFVPAEHAYQAVLAVEKLRDRITPHLFVSELRAVAGDDLPLSMCFGRDSLAFHFTWKQELDAVLSVLPHVEAALEPFGARPHWAKLFTTSPERIRSLYPQLDTFGKLAREYDPVGKFRNAYLAELFG